MSNQFDTVLNERLSKIKNILGEKAKQYQRTNDRYHQFRIVGMFEHISPELALWHMVMKHISALSFYINDLPQACQSREQWDEKIGDIINYLVLLEGMIDERLETKGLKKNE